MKSARILTLVLILCMVSVCFLSGTVAKYTSNATGTDATRVANWSFVVNTTDIAKVANETFTFDLFKTVKDTAGANEEDVDKTAADDHQIIAPGTSGSFEIVVTNASQVNAKFEIDFTYTEKLGGVARDPKQVPIVFSLDNSTWESDINDLDFTGTDARAIKSQQADAVNYTQTVTVYWKWDFETAGGDTADTALGVESFEQGLIIEVSAEVTATQVD